MSDETEVAEPPSLPALVVEAVPVGDLELLPDNPRRGDVAAVARSLAAFGQRKPIVARRSDRAVLAGNHTLLAARSLDWPAIAVVWVDDDPVMARAYALADNRTAELGSYDYELLAETIAGVQEADPALLAATGWTPDDLAAMLADLVAKPLPRTDPDYLPPKPRRPHSKPGDLWLCGPHRVLCGDATDEVAFDRLLAGDEAGLVWTDPPYGVAYVGGTDERLRLENDDLDSRSLEALLRSAFGLAVGRCRKGAAWYVASPGGPQIMPFARVLVDLGIWRQTIIWAKDRFVLGRSDFHYRHEDVLYGWEPSGLPPAPPLAGLYEVEQEEVLYGWKPGAAHTGPPDRKQDTIWEIARPEASRDHPTMKPVALIARALSNSSAPGDLVLDPFAGSGSTLIACEQLDRRGRMLELDGRFVDVICRRWQEHVGVEPVLEATGVPHDFVAGAA